eukprot:1268079-Alexandrium_andersonii.AAC.1
MGNGILVDNFHLQALDLDGEKFDDEMAPNTNLEYDTPLADMLPGLMRGPTPKPSQKEIDLRKIPHATYAKRCEIYRETNARGKNRPRVDHAQRAENVVQADYTFWKADGTRAENLMGASAASLTMVHVDTGYPLTVLVAKEGSWPYVVQAAVRYLSMCGEHITLQGDAEESLQGLLEAISQARPEGGTTVRFSLPYSHQSSDAAEKMHATIRARVHALLMHIQKMTGKIVVPKDRMFAWAARHAGWIVGRCM